MFQNDTSSDGSSKPVFENQGNKECVQNSYHIKLFNDSCFVPKPVNITKLPALSPTDFGLVEFGLKENVKCNDTFNLLGAQLPQPCACDTKISSIRAPCEHFFRSLIGIQSESKVINFRDVEYVPGLEKQIHFSDSEMADEHLNDFDDPLYFHRSYYQTCDRLLGVPEVSTVDSCSRHAKFDISESPSTQMNMYINFKKSPIKDSLRSGCTVSECLSHLRYMPPNRYSMKKNPVLADDGSPDTSFDICKEEIQDCPAWDFNSKTISIKNRPAGITSFLELDIQAFPNTNRSAIIFSFRSETRPMYEGLRFLLNGVPAMDLVYNQTDFKGFAVPLVPGKSHIARWEFVQIDDSISAYNNYVELQSIILRDARIANSWEVTDLYQNAHIGHSMVHLAPAGPSRHVPVQTVASHADQTAALAASLSAIAMLFSLLTGIAIACLIIWLWTRHRKQKRENSEHEVLGSYNAPLGFAERIAQFSFSGSEQSSRYAPLNRSTAPRVDIEAIELFENHLPSPNEDESIFEDNETPDIQPIEKKTDLM